MGYNIQVLVCDSTHKHKISGASMKKTKKVLALALAATVACACFAGCDLVTKDAKKDFKQVIAQVDITRSEDFAEGGIYAGYNNIIQPSDILKRDMVAYYIDSGYSMQNTYGWTYQDTFNWIASNLVTRQIEVQYALVYFLENKVEVDGKNVSIEDYNATVVNPEDELAGLKYFLDEEEEAKALYSARKLFNNTLDSQEKNYIDSSSDSSSATAERTLPTGVNTDNSDYYDETYRVYTGLNKASDCGSYETLDGSKATTRKSAYLDFLSNLNRNDLLGADEDTGKIEELSYFQYELKSYYESAILTKFNECLEAEAKEKLTQEYMEEKYEELYQGQVSAFKDKSTFESALDGMSDSNFVLTAPEENYGFVINILLPFSTAQSNALSAFQPDLGDAKGNKFMQRASLLQQITATDQRGSWFTGKEDYSFKATEGYGFKKYEREYLFFEDSLLHAGEGEKYEELKNYYGKYTYNGAVYYNEDKEKYILSPNKININGFIEEMEGYLDSAGFNVVPDSEYAGQQSNYFKRDLSSYYNADGTVNYKSFIYHAGKVEFDNFDANKLFVAGSEANDAFSIINELSFAYNTDTAGLNSYLGYSVVVGKTNFVSEFEYAAQLACKGGAGTYVIAPSDYGWHIIYCTFSFKDNGGIQPFTYNHADHDKEGTFSYLFYEAVKATAEQESSNEHQQIIVNKYRNCKTIYEDRFADLTGMGS